MGVKLSDPQRGIYTQYFWNRALTLTIPRVVIVQIWQLGLLNKILQIFVLIYFLNTMVAEHTWAQEETPSNRVNAWIEGGTIANSWAASSSSLATSYPYCSNTAYDFTYSAEFTYTNIHCEPLNAFEIATKLPQTTVLSTVFLDITEEGWDCAAANAAAKASACTSGGGTTATLFGTQCTCTTRQTTYPISTDQMNMAFEHRFSTSATMDNLAGSSSIATDALTTTTVNFNNGSAVVFQPGSAVRLTISDWLKAAETALTLDSRNTEVAADITNSSSYPYFRTTGAVILLDIEYTNIAQGEDGPNVGFNKNVRAIVKPKIEKDWAGLAVKAPIYESLVTGSAGAQTYTKKLRYSQGVVFKFQGSGKVYRFDFNYAVTQLTNAIVLLGLASTLVTFFAKYMWTTRKMVYNKSTERLAVGTRLAEIALKAATHATAFNVLKRDHHSVKAADLAHIFHSAGADLTEDEANGIAAFVIDRVNDDPEDTVEGKTEMNFDEYMRGMEAGAMIRWNQFKKLVTARIQRRTSLLAAKSAVAVKVLPANSTTVADS